LNLKLGNFRHRNDLLNIHQEARFEAIRLEPNAANVDTVIDQPQHGRGDLLGKFSRREHDPNILGELIFVRRIPAEEVENGRTGILIDFSLRL
jgi:hypothetical protein